MKVNRPLFFLFLLFLAPGILMAGPYDVPSTIPDTGQTKCYDSSGDEISCSGTGQDGEFAINPMRYTKLADGTVKDEVTGLIWEVKESADGEPDYDNPNDADNIYTWYDPDDSTNGGYEGTESEHDTQDFLTALKGKTGYADWRLPSREELRSLIDYSIPVPEPSINTAYFLNTLPSEYWSATTFDFNTDLAWYVTFMGGLAHNSIKSNGCYVRAVRGGQELGPLGNLVLNGDGTITDTRTGLIWEQKTDDGGMRDKDRTYTWREALAYCNDLNLANHTDWRLPTIKELASLADLSRYNPAIHPLLVADSSPYWSSTTHIYYGDYAWCEIFHHGYDSGYSKSLSQYVRAVRSGQGGGSTGDFVIAQRPMAGPAGTIFTQWGTGFTPNGNVTFRIDSQSGQGIGAEAVKTYSDGSFEVRYTAPETQPVGIYEWHAVDEATGRTSNTVTYEITNGPYPEIGNFPQRGTVETVFEQIGTGFTPGGTATLYFFDSQGQPNGTQNVSINNYGNFKITYDPPDAKPLGRYDWYASDNSTGRETLEISYWIDSPSPPTGSQSVNEDPSATSTTDPEYPLLDQLESLENVEFNPGAEVTTILVHGWQQDTDRTSAWHVPWVNTMAQVLRNREDMNVLAFNWLKDARGEGGAPPSQELVKAHGETLAEKIRNLSYVEGFQGKFHLITHSAGTGVCYQAVDSLTRSHNQISIDHLTTLDPYLFDADKAMKELKDFQEPWTASASKARSILLKSWIAAYRNVPILENVFMDHYTAGIGTVSQILAFGHMVNSLASGNNNYIFHPDFRVIEESYFFQDKVSDQSYFVDIDPGVIGVLNELHHKPPVNWYLASIVDQLRLAGASQNSDNHPYGYYWASILENGRPRKGTEKLLLGFQDYFDLHSALTIFGPLVADPLLEISAAIEDEVREQMELLIRLEKMTEALGRKVIIKNADFLDNSVDWVSSQASKVYYDAKGFFWLESGSPTMLSKDYQIPADTPFLGVMYKAVQADGMDSISLFINDEMVWSKPLKSQVGDGLLISSLIDVSEWADQTVRLTFRVNSFDNPSAIVEIHDLIFAELGNIEEIWNYDGDQDGMADAWEILHHGSTDFDGSDDSDKDGLTDLDEFELGTEPKLMDTDGDGKNDLEEVQTNDNPLVASTPDGNPVTRPEVDAGENQTVCEGTLVTLVGTASEVAGYPSFEWEQVSGPAVSAFPAYTPNTRFIAPEVDSAGALMTLKVTVTDSTDGMASDTCDIQVVNREPGDLNCSQDLDLQDAIISLRILAGHTFSDDLTSADVTGEGKIELSEAIFIIQAVAEKR